MLERSDLSFERQSEGSDLACENIRTSGFSRSSTELEEVPFMSQSLPPFNEVFEVIRNKGQCLISGFKNLKEVSQALERYGKVEVYHSSNQDPSVLDGGKVLGAIWNDSGESGRDVHIAVIKETETGSWESDDFLLHPGQVVLWDPKEVRYLPLSSGSNGENDYCSFTVVVNKATVAAAQNYLEGFKGPWGLTTTSQGRYSSR